ncbi:MAG: NAD(P)/FAD-dependent oxidoreductase [Endomicrobiales bacterium]
MPERKYAYVIVGAGLAGANAAEAIRGLDKNGPVLMAGLERNLPYDRPPLTKQLWWGTQQLEEIFVHDDAFYIRNGVEVLRETLVTAIDPGRKTVTDSSGKEYGYEKLLLATGGVPRQLALPGGTDDGILYYRYLEDYKAARKAASPGASATIVGGGFIGSELGASLRKNNVGVTLIFPDEYIASRVLPDHLGRAVQDLYLDNGVTLLTRDAPVSFERAGDGFVTTTRNGQRITSDLLIVGIGINPSVTLARDAGLKTGRGIVVNGYLQSSHPDIYAAGDNALYPSPVTGRYVRHEHWDNARVQGAFAGRNMAGAREKYTYLPDFFSDIFQVSLQGVGDIRSEYRTVADWREEKLAGTFYYLENDRVVGVLMSNVRGNADEAREIIRKGEVPERLKAAT